MRSGRGLRALGAVGALDGTQRRGYLRALLGGLRPGLRAALGGRGRGALRGLGLRRAGLRAVLRPLRGLLRGGRLRGRGLRGRALRRLTLPGRARATGARRLLGGGARGESTRDGTGGGRAEGRVGVLVHRLSPGGASYKEKNAPSVLIRAITTTARIPCACGKAQLAVPQPRSERRGKVRRMAGSPAPSAVVTGAARGFGKEIARPLVARGHRVLITDLDAGAVAQLGPVLARLRARSERRRVATP